MTRAGLGTSRVELFEAIRRDARREDVGVRELARAAAGAPLAAAVPLAAVTVRQRDRARQRRRAARQASAAEVRDAAGGSSGSASPNAGER